MTRQLNCIFQDSFDDGNISKWQQINSILSSSIDDCSDGSPPGALRVDASGFGAGIKLKTLVPNLPPGDYTLDFCYKSSIALRAGVNDGVYASGNPTYSSTFVSTDTSWVQINYNFTKGTSTSDADIVFIATGPSVNTFFIDDICLRSQSVSTTTTTTTTTTTMAPQTTLSTTTTAVPETTRSITTTAVPETTVAPTTTAVPETTVAPTTTAVPETTVAPTTTAVPETTRSITTTTAVPETTVSLTTTVAPTTTKAPTTTEEPCPNEEESKEIINYWILAMEGFCNYNRYSRQRRN
jgi:hypothetical protein